MNISTNVLLDLQRQLDTYMIKLELLVDLEENREYVCVTNSSAKVLHKAYDEDSIVNWARGFIQGRSCR